MTQFFNRIYFLVYIVIGIGILFATSFCQHEFVPPDNATYGILEPDSEIYISLSNKLNTLVDSQEGLWAERTIGYPLLLAISKTINHKHYFYIVILFQWLLHLGVIFLVTKYLAENVELKKIMPFCLLMILIDPALNTYWHVILTDSISASLAGLWIVLNLRLLWRIRSPIGVEDKNSNFREDDYFVNLKTYAYLPIISLTILIRPYTYYVLVLLLSFFIIQLFVHKLVFTKKSLIVLVCLGIVFFWPIKNKIVYGHFNISSQAGADLLFFRAVRVLEISRNLSSKDASTICQTMLNKRMNELGVEANSNPFVISKIKAEVAKGIFTSNMYGTLYATIEGGARYLLGPGWKTFFSSLGASREILPARILNLLWLPVNMIVGGLAILGMGLLLRRFRWDFVPILLLVGYHFVIFASPTGYSRFRLPLQIGLYLFAGYGLIALKSAREAFPK